MMSASWKLGAGKDITYMRPTLDKRDAELTGSDLG
jgi:hypothetical protein